MQSEDQRFLQPVIGEQIYFRDGLLGTVQKVVIHPYNRRVVSMIVKIQNNYHQAELESLMYGKALQPERLIIIPMNITRYMTKSSGFLLIHSAETARYMDFDPSFYSSPEKGWMPPYPYCLDNVLFPVESLGELNQAESEPTTIPAMLSWFQPAIQSGVSE